MAAAPSSADGPVVPGVSESAQAERRIREMRPWLLLARIALLVVLLAGLVVIFESLVPGAGKRLSAARPAWLAFAVGLEALALVSYVALFHAVFARSPHRLSLRRSAGIALSELAGFVVAPGGVGGPVLRVWMLRGGGMPWRAIGARSVAHGAVFNAPYVAAALVFGLGVALHITPGHVALVVALTPIALVCATLLAVIALTSASRARRLRSPSSRWGKALRAALEVVPDGVRQLPHFFRHPVGFAAALGYWADDCAVLWACFHAFGGVPSLSVLVLAYMLGQLGNALPLPGGIGGVEPLMLGILVASGVGAALAAAAIICYRAVSLGLQVGAGAVAVSLTSPGLPSLASRR
jgi:uncharacterized protein (TIRG00374 family)